MPLIVRKMKRLALRARQRLFARKFRTSARRLTFSKDFSKMVYPYKQWTDGTLLTQNFITSSNLVENCYAWSFTLNMLPQVATFAALYDEYRIASIEFIVRPHGLANLPFANSQGATSQYNGTICIVNDHDDATVPASYNVLREYSVAKEFNPNLGKEFRMVFTPHVSQQIYNGVTPSYKSIPAPWLDMGITSTPHYGVKVAMHVTAFANITTCDIDVRYLLECRQSR